MDNKIILGVVALAAVATSLLLLAPDNSVNTPDTLPWKISHPTPDTTRIFGVTLGQTSLDEAAQTFKHQAEIEISLFKPSEGKIGVEAGGEWGVSTLAQAADMDLEVGGQQAAVFDLAGRVRRGDQDAKMVASHGTFPVLRCVG